MTRCIHCKRYTELDQTDVATGQPECLTCATVGMNRATDIVGECSRCGYPTTLMVGFTDRPPHVCIDCTLRKILKEEALASK